ncbi:unnamed protein product [Adineta ricciae]|uniref:AMP-binding enzyme C-terminal domain-containing protein n=1 Tax=Adineta ricciae TaxID=249248 RepID=A0A816H2Q6_ADIRI|nr:unnamed protein product [Adineta ricciae]
MSPESFKRFGECCVYRVTSPMESPNYTNTYFFQWAPLMNLDDVLIISGHNIGTAEVESALVLHPTVSEAAVVGYPDPIKNQGMYCFVTLKKDVIETDELKKELVRSVRETIGAHVIPDVIHFAPNLPTTRSGKIMRRILRKIVEPDIDNLGDISTLIDPTVVVELIKKCPRTKPS